VSSLPVFLSWSGELSELVASKFRTWLKTIFGDTVKPFFSRDIPPGERGIRDIEAALREANHVIVFLTRENRGSEWIAFESGAVGKDPGESYVYPILVNFPVGELAEPLKLFQIAHVSEESKILEVFDRISHAARGAGLNSAEKEDLREWIVALNTEVARYVATTLEGSPYWANTTLTKVSSDTANSPFQAEDALRVARRRVVFVGQNMYSFTQPQYWDGIRDFLLRKRKFEHGASAKDRSVDILFMAPDDPDKPDVVQALVDAWAYTVAANPGDFRDNLEQSVAAWQDRKNEAVADGYGDRIKVRLARNFIPLSQSFVDPDESHGDGKLFLRPFYRDPVAARRPIVFLTQKDNQAAFDFYWSTHNGLWTNNTATRPL